MSPAARPWKALTPAEKVEATRPLEADGQAPSTIAWKLKAPQPEIARICSLIRREREAKGEEHPPQNPEAKASEDNGATGQGCECAELTDSVAGEASRVDAGRTASATSEHGRDSLERQAPNSREGADETRGGLPVAAASGTAEETGRNAAVARTGRHGTPHESGVTAGETATSPVANTGEGANGEIAAASIDPVSRDDDGADRRQPASSGFTGEGDGQGADASASVTINLPTDGGAIAAVKGKARLANAAGVEPSPSTIEHPGPLPFGGRSGRPSIPSPDAARAKSDGVEPLSSAGPAYAGDVHRKSGRAAFATPPRTDPEPAMPGLVKSWEQMDSREKEEAVLPFAKQGMASSAIAKKLGVPSRNSIITVIGRLRAAQKLPPAAPKIAGTTPRSRKRVAAKPAEKKTPHRKPSARTLEVVSWRGANNPHHNDLKARAEQRANSVGLTIRREFAFDPIAGVEPVPFGSAGCKWPVDGLQGKGLLWCGQPRDTAERTEEPYCTAHGRLAYTPAFSRPSAPAGA